MAEEITVRKIDLDNIVNFALLAEELKALKVSVKDLEKEKISLDDVEDEVILSESLRAGEGMLYRYGDAFIEMEDSRFEEVIQEEKSNVESQLQKDKSRLATVESKVATLKADLKVRFGEQIGLDFD